MKPDERTAHFGRRPAVSGDWALVRSGLGQGRPAPVRRGSVPG